MRGSVLRTALLLAAAVCAIFVFLTVHILCEWGFICEFAPVNHEFAVTASPCLKAYLHEIDTDRIGVTRSLNSDLYIPGSEGPQGKEFGLIIIGPWKPIGALRFTHNPTAKIVNVESIVDASCSPVERYSIVYEHHNESYSAVAAYRYGDRNILSVVDGSKDVLWVHFGSTAYQLKLWHNGNSLEGELW